MADSFEDSLTRDESELVKLREEVRKNAKIIDEKNTIISSLRQQVDDLQREAEEFEASEQVMRQKIDRMKKEHNEKDETIEAISHALKEVEAGHETLTRRFNARVEQVQKLVTENDELKRVLEEVKTQNERNHHQKQLLAIELEAAKLSIRENKRDSNEVVSQELHDLRQQVASLQTQNSTLQMDIEKYRQHQKHHLEKHELKRLLKEIEDLKAHICQLKLQNNTLASNLKNAAPTNTSQTNEEMVQELYDLRAKVKSLSHRQSRRSIDEEILKLKQELEVTETSWNLEKIHKERYARENLILEKRMSEMIKEINELRKLQNQVDQPPPLPPKLPAQPKHEQHENKTNPMHFSTIDEVGEFMDKTHSIPTTAKENQLQPQPDYRLKKSQFLFDDPIAEERMRIQRANELARRNMQTKPLHQTSYPLELDTYDPTLTENQIKRGQLNKVVALGDSSNQRRVCKKAEAFII